MKGFFALSLFALVLLQLSSATPAEFVQHFGECLKEAGIQPDEFSMDHPTKEQMCVYKCVAKKMGILDENDKLVEGAIGRKAPPALKDRVKECENITKDDICEQVYEILQCVRKLKPN